MTEPIITFKNVGKVFPKTGGGRRIEALKSVDLTVHKGEFLVLLGPSGSGKSTLLRIAAGLDQKTSGMIEYGAGFDPKNSSFVFQNFGILPWLTVSQNVGLNLVAKKLPPRERAKEISRILDLLGLAAFKDHHPHDLSGGMRQRVGLARAFVSRPSVIFLDEPFSELDFFTAENLRRVLADLWREQKATVIMVSHYIDEAVALADRIAIFSDRPGMIRAVIHNDLPRPRDNRSAPFYELEDKILSHFEVVKK